MEESIEKAKERHGEIKITALELIGGNTNTPFVQKIMKSVFGIEPLTNLNGDEVIAHGCAVLVSVFGFTPQPLK